MSEPSMFSTILSNIGTFVTSATSWVTSWLSTITGNDVLMLFCIVLPLSCMGIGIIRRLVRIRA